VGVFAFTTVGSRHKQHSWLLRGTSAPIKYRENTAIKSTDRPQYGSYLLFARYLSLQTLDFSCNSESYVT
jgi:hypothetical protein